MTATLVRQGPLTYSFPQTGQDIRSILVDGDPWFVGKDIADILGYANTRKAVKDHVPAGHRKGNESFPLSDLGFDPQTILIDEAGMYRLILRANTPTAEQFQEWVTAEVLPAIRKTGGYGSAAKGADSIRTLGRRELAEMIIAEADRADAAEQRAAELEPAAEAWESLAGAAGDLSLKDAAAVLNRDPAISTGRNRLLQLLKDEQLVDRTGRPYVKYAKYLVERMGTWQHPSGEDRLYHAVRVTPEGVEYLRRRLGGIRKAAA